MKYMVVEIHPGYAVVLDEDGRFLKVANRHYTVGLTVTDVVQMQYPSEKKTRKWIYSLAAMAACLALILGISLPIAQQPYASVYVKINPEVRIDVDREDMVVGLEGINQDGIYLIEDYDFQKKDLNLVTHELVDRAIDMGYLQAGGQVTISLDAQDQIWVDTHTQSLHSHLQTHLQERIAGTIQIQSHHSEDHNSGGEHDDHGDTETSLTNAAAEPQRGTTHEHEERENSHHDD